MHKLSLIYIFSLSLILFFHGGEARQRELPLTRACHFSQINSLGPAQATKFEAGQMEVWDHTSPELRCAGVTVARITLHPNSIFLPSFFTSPALAYVVQGGGVMGTISSGCPETYIEEIERSGEMRRRFEDMHHKLENFRRGDVFALLAGVSQWWYNQGNSDVVIVIVLDVTNRENQLDQVPRMFEIAGGSKTQEQQEPLTWPSGNNALSGFDPKIIAEAFKIDIETAKNLQNHKDKRGNIVRVNGPLHFVISPPRKFGNGIEETYCTARIHENIDDPERSDFFSTRAGRISTLDSLNLPVLRRVRLNALRGVLYSGGMMLPHWTANANTVLYVTGGQAKVQMVDDKGQSVFNAQIGQGQVLMVPQGFMVVKTAGETGFEWVAFKTNDNAYINTLSGETSYLRAIPVDVIKAAHGVTEEEAKRIKFSQQETLLAMTSSS